MKSASFARRAAAAVLAAAVLCASALPAFAEGEQAENTASKEEVIYGKLAPDGTVQSIYAVNHFEATAGDPITDYGSYTAVRNMTTTDPLTQGDGTVSLTPSADGSVYYEGTMDPSTPLPWLIEVHYILDGTEVEPEDLAGRSGALIIRIDVNPNPDCNGDWFNQYALQTTVTLDTAHADNIRADGGTIASVGSEKQIVFTLLPGQTSEVEVAADVTDFTMPAITFNGVQLQLKLDIDGVSLTNRLNQLTTGTGQLDEGTAAVSEGITALQQGLTMLSQQSGLLTTGSSAINSALSQLQSAVSGISASNDQLSALLTASSQIGDGLAQLDDGVAQLDNQVNYEAFKEILAQNGLDLDTLTQGNQQAIAMLQNLTCLPVVGDQISQIILLLQGNTALSSAVQMYLDTVSSGIGALRQGTSAVREGYDAFDQGIQAMATALNGMLQNMALLSDAVTTLATQYSTFDTGVNAYTQGVDQILAGTQQLGAASALLVSGAHQLYTQTSSLHLDEQLSGLLNALSGAQTPVSFTSSQNTGVTALQFALQTQPIELPADQTAQDQPAKEMSFWDKLLNLFGLYTEE